MRKGTWLTTALLLLAAACSSASSASFVGSEAGVWNDDLQLGTLTSGGANERNAIVTADTYPTAAVRIRAELFAAGKADGIALAFIAPEEQPFGGIGSGIGISWISAAAVYVDTYQNEGDPAVPYVGVSDFTNSGTLTPYEHSQPLTDFQGSWHAVDVTLDDTAITVHLDGRAVLTARRPANLPDRARIGFSASTGGYTGVHYVRDITIDADGS